SSVVPRCLPASPPRRSSDLVVMCETPFHGLRAITKRMIDIVIASALLVLALPVMVLIALLVKATSPGSVLFKQRRYGLDGKEIIDRKSTRLNSSHVKISYAV